MACVITSLLFFSQKNTQYLVSSNIISSINGSKEIGEFEGGKIIGRHQCSKSNKDIAISSRLIIKGSIMLSRYVMKKAIVVWINVQKRSHRVCVKEKGAKEGSHQKLSPEHQRCRQKHGIVAICSEKNSERASLSKNCCRKEALDLRG